MRRLVLLLVALALALAGCGGNGDSDEPGVGDTGAATTDMQRTGTIDDGDDDY